MYQVHSMCSDTIADIRRLSLMLKEDILMRLQNLRSSAAFVLLFILLVPILAACGGTPTTPAADAPTATSGEAAQAEPTATAAEAAQAEPTATAAEAAQAEPTATTGEAAPATDNAKPGV